MLKVENFFAISCSLQSIISVSKSPTTTPLRLSGPLNTLHCDLIAFHAVLAFFLLMICMLAVELTFLSNRVYPFLNFFQPLLFLVDHIICTNQHLSKRLFCFVFPNRLCCSSSANSKTDFLTFAFLCYSTNLFILG